MQNQAASAPALPHTHARVCMMDGVRVKIRSAESSARFGQKKAGLAIQAYREKGNGGRTLLLGV